MDKQPPSLGRIILVTTPESLNGQSEHAAIVTQVWARDDVVNATLFPGSGGPICLPEIYPKGHPRAPDDRCWRYPPKVPPRSS